MWYDFHNFRTYGLNGIYRHMMSKPSDLKWKFLNYDDPDQSLITSDLNRLTKIASPPVDLPGIISSS
jgi:tRNA pseudouridine13 synthase